jgi:hypothetical protein
MSDYIPPSHWTWTRGGAPIAVEGVHFLGNGFTFVVFTVTMPPTGGDPRPSADPAAAPAGQSDWERLQRQLRGETAPASAALERKAPTVGDVLLHLLAENGKHFTALRDDERLTVAVTFRGPRPDARQPIVTTFQPQPAANALNLTGTLNVSGGTVTVTTEQTARDLELLGDLHLKQQKYAEALDALHKAVTAVENDLQKNPSGPERRQELERLSSLYSKLAQAQLATGRMDEARATLERARGTSQEATRTAQGQTTAPAAAKPGGSVLPARLTLSAPKRLLDEVGSGKMSFEQFRKQVTVEYVPATGGKATK